MVCVGGAWGWRIAADFCFVSGIPENIHGLFEAGEGGLKDYGKAYLIDLSK